MDKILEPEILEKDDSEEASKGSASEPASRTYDESKKSYYQRNKALIAARTRLYRKQYNARYYKKNKQKVIQNVYKWRERKRLEAQGKDLIHLIEDSFTQD